MPLYTWWTFVIATFFISATPGPNMLHMMASGIRHGLRSTFFAMAGCMAAVLLITSISSAGVGAVLEASPDVFSVLRWCGAGYLIYLGVRSFRQPATPPIDSQMTAEVVQNANPSQLFRSGFMVGVSNPKLLLFATAFFPQFIDSENSELLQFSILLATFFCIELGWYMVYAIGGSQFALYLSSPRTQRIMARVIGALFIFFGVLLLKYHP